MLSGLFAESRALGKSASLPRAYLSANLPLCRELGGRLSANLFFFSKTTSAANLFFNNSLPTVALGKEAVTPLAFVWPLLGQPSLPRAIVSREP